MDIQDLRYFLATYETGNYARAADKLFISRQALRQKLQRLEEELGGPLFLPGRKLLEPTDLGYHLYQESRDIVSQFDSMELNLLAHSQQKKAEISMAMGLGAATFLSHDLLLNFQRDYPQIVLQLSENSDTVVVSDVKSGKVDLGIVGASSDMLTEVDAIQIQTSRLYLHIAESNPLSQKAELEIADLKDQPFVSYGAQSHAHHFLLKECQACGFEPKCLFCIQDIQASHSIASKHNGITWSYPPNRLEYTQPGFRIVPLKVSNHSWGTYIISQPGRKQTTPTHVLIQYLCEHAEDV